MVSSCLYIHVGSSPPKVATVDRRTPKTEESKGRRAERDVEEPAFDEGHGRYKVPSKSFSALQRTEVGPDLMYFCVC